MVIELLRLYIYIYIYIYRIHKYFTENDIFMELPGIQRNMVRHLQ